MPNAEFFLSKIMGAKPLNLLALAGKRSAVSGSGDPYSLVFTMQQQSESNWCWAAVATSVGLFFKTGTWTQCEIVDANLGRTDCCASPSSAPCNRGYSLPGPLRSVSCYGGYQSGAANTSQISQQIDDGNPVCLRILWGQGPYAHFVAIIGYNDQSSSDFKVQIADSIFKYSWVSYADFPTHYHSGGTWTGTYWTKVAAAASVDA